MARAVFLDKGDGYGFHLASEKGVQFIRRIVEDSPAQNAGMLEGDRLLGVCKFELLSYLDMLFYLSDEYIIKLSI